jgi:hypothetical protein
MKHLCTMIYVLLICLNLFGNQACKQEAYSPVKAGYARGLDPIMIEIEAFQSETRAWYNSQEFEKLEQCANQIRAKKERFGNGSWKIYQLYDSLECRKNEPESMWQLHEQIHQAWEKKFPDSITARVAYIEFLTSYAWHARGEGYANEVTEDGWQHFYERLAAARTILGQSRSLTPSCPEYWAAGMTLALGQGWNPEDFKKFYAEAKAVEPQYFAYDLAQAHFLMPRWYGVSGDWEAAAVKEIDRPEGLGLEGYARVVCDRRGYYDDIFRESKASWKLTQQGFEQMRKRYPDSIEILNAYCRLACIAGDRNLANQLFEQIGDRVVVYCWGERRRYVQQRNWARQN